MQRRRFLVALGSAPGLAALSGLAVAALPACGSGAEPDPDAQGAGFAVDNAGDDSGHLHRFELPCADLAGPTRSYPTDGEDHQHSVVLEAADLSAVAAGETVVIAFTDGHEHTFRIALPAGSCQAGEASSD
jgi:hypothetical protein